MNIEQAISQRENMQSSIKTNTKKLEDELLKNDVLKRDILTAKNKYEGFSSDKTDENYQRQAEEHKRQLDNLRLEKEQSDQAIEALRIAIAADEAELNSFNIEANPKDLVELQKNIKSSQQKTADIQKLIADQEGIIDEAEKGNSNTGELKKQRSMLLAESAANGTDNSKKLSDIDVEIVKAEKAYLAKEATITKAMETKEGLGNMLASIRETISSQQQMEAYMLTAILLKMAAVELGKYKQVAAILADSLRSISAIDSLIGRTGISPHSGIYPPETHQVIIPALGDMQSQQNNGLYFHWYTGGPAELVGIEAVTTLLKAQGIEV
jgi:hypothetical protein